MRPSSIAVALVLMLGQGLPAQQTEVFCAPQEREDCLPDALEIVFDDTGTSTFELSGPEAGVEISCAVVTETRSEPIRGWVYAVKHDQDVLALESITTEGTIVDPDNPDGLFESGFNVTKEVAGGWISAVVLSFFEDRRLPVGQRNQLALATYETVSPPDPAGTLIQFADNELRDEPDMPLTRVRMTTDAPVEWLPETLVHGLVIRPVSFIRGDSDGNGELALDDAVFILGWWFLGEEAPGCVDACDSNDSGEVDVSDVVYTLNFLFFNGPAPPPPWGGCDPDPTDDDLSCESHPPCEAGA